MDAPAGRARLSFHLIASLLAFAIFAIDTFADIESAISVPNVLPVETEVEPTYA